MENIANNTLKLIEYLDLNDGLGLHKTDDMSKTLRTYASLFNQEITEKEFMDAINRLLAENKIRNIGDIFEVVK